VVFGRHDNHKFIQESITLRKDKKITEFDLGGTEFIRINIKYDD
jgi:hypothetical protein